MHAPTLLSLSDELIGNAFSQEHSVMSPLNLVHKLLDARTLRNDKQLLVSYC